MKLKTFLSIKILILLYSICQSIQIPLHMGPRCMILTATFEPIKVQIQFPNIPNKLEGQRYRVSLTEYVSGNEMYEEFVEGEFLFRKNYELDRDVLYNLCLEIIQVRSYFQPEEQVYVKYIATEDFQALIGKIQIPPELSGQENLQSIYKVAKQLTNLNKNILENQKKQRQLQDKLVTQNVHKNQRIYILTLIECLVIVLSGVYQVFALRKFLIDKNLY